VRTSRHLRDYFDLQLRFAAAITDRTGRALANTVACYTNVHRRFGLGILRGPPSSAAWQHYLQGLLEAPGHEERVTWTVAFHGRCAAETLPPGRHVFGCFACDAPDAEGRLRIHFANRDTDGTSPLAADKAERRRAELGALFAFVAEAHPRAQSVRGTSWLYHLEAYRRLFPPEYAASRRAPDGPLHFHGSSSWGQFLDHRGRVRAEPRAAFQRNLQRLDPDRLREAFPLPVLATTAPVAAFYAHYRRAVGVPPSGR
jgi:hypothetical protein